MSDNDSNKPDDHDFSRSQLDRLGQKSLDGPARSLDANPQPGPDSKLDDGSGSGGVSSERFSKTQPLRTVAGADLPGPPSHHSEIDGRQGNAQPSMVIGPYKLLQQLGEGGMGEVWIAKQSHPVRRRVALKLIKSGVGSKEIVARFEGERQALSLMNHPNIARILDAGTTADGRPFFAMELVQGQTLVQYCDQNRLSINDRLQLFIDICAGVQHAHQKGIIHRDLKPANILVTVIDGVAVPKVIDFGLAKAMESTQRLHDQSLFTGIGQILGTLRYMSPEQASLDAIDIDTRTDVYALGVVLYELLAGSTPLDEETLKGAAVLKLLELIREKEPVKPSSRLSQCGDWVKAVTKARRTDIGSLNRILVGDLDWVVLKALEKDRTRRYESVSGFAADIYRYLNNEPVIARPPSLHYRLRKFVRKNRVGVIAGTMVTLALVGGIVGTSLGLLRALQAEALAERRRDEAIEARNQETEQRRIADQQAEIAQMREAEARESAELAEREKMIAQAVRNFLQDKLLRPVNVWDQARVLGKEQQQEARYDVTVRELLARAADEYSPTTIETKFPGELLVQSEILETIGYAFHSIGDYEQASNYLKPSINLREKLLGPSHLDVIHRRIDFAYANFQSERHIAAIDQGGRVVEILLKMMEDRTSANEEFTDPKAIQSVRDVTDATFSSVLEKLESKFRIDNEALPEMDMGVVDGAVLALRLGQVLGKLERLHQLCEYEFGATDRRTMFAKFLCACTLHAVGQFNAARTLYLEIHLQAEAELDEDDLLLAGVRSLLSVIYGFQKEHERSLELVEKVFVTAERVLGRDHPSTLVVMNNLARGYHAVDQLEKAMPLYEESLALSKQKLGPDHPETLNKMDDLAEAYRDAGQLEKALTLYEETIELMKDRLGPDHPDTLYSMTSLARGYYDAGQLENAIPLHEEMLAVRKQKFGLKHTDTLRSMYDLAVVFRDFGQLHNALPLFEQSLELRKSQLGPDHRDTLIVMNNLAESYRFDGQLDKALPLYQKSLKLHKQKLGPDHPDTLAGMNNLATGYFDAGQLDKALPLYQETLKLFEQKLGPDHPGALNCLHNLAWCYKKADELDMAMALFEKAARGIEKQGFQHGQVRLIIVNTIRAFEEAEQFEKAETWRQKWMAHVKATAGADSPAYISELVRLGLSLLQRQKWAEAEPVLRNGLAIRETNEPDVWTTFNTMSLLGEALLGQARSVSQGGDSESLARAAERYREAEALLLKGYVGMKAREQTIPPQGSTRIPEALDRLIELYTALQQPDEVAKYQELRNQYPAKTDASDK